MEEYRNWTVSLPRTAAAWKAGVFDELEATIDDELAGNVLEFLDHACESGGWPEDDELTVDSVDIDGEMLIADISVSFTELIASSCKDIPHHENREARLVITLKRGEPQGTVDYSSSDTYTWDLIDRNSAADGS